MSATLSKAETFAALPQPWPHDLMPAIRAHLAAHRTKVVVLDDDPTGTQTVHDIAVLTEWSEASLLAELQAPGPGFYILTNSRAFPTAEACRINREIGERLSAAAKKCGCEFRVISRSDSTLRGHFPDEVDAFGAAISGDETKPPVLLCPYFEAGGRYTIGDVHYVAEGDRLVPSGETPFARDASFGYRASNLREWIVEKSLGRIALNQITSLTLADNRERGSEAIAPQLMLAYGAACVANVACQRDLEVVVFAALMAEARGARTIYRTGASFVATRMGLEPRPLLEGRDMVRATNTGGLVIVGSYVPKTTEQLGHLLDKSDIARVELAVDSVQDAASASAAIRTATEQVDALLSAGKDVVLYTSRNLVTGADADASLRIGQRVSSALVEITSGLTTPPRFFIAKGGITSSDLATRALGVRRAMVRGQILPGIPVWQLGDEARFPGLNYVVFPGNVGGPEALLEAYRKLAS
ncbi:MAG: four-carbon acid sugar kinase family protein [Chthoniobacteraceae bacterium]